MYRLRYSRRKRFLRCMTPLPSARRRPLSFVELVPKGVTGQLVLLLATSGVAAPLTAAPLRVALSIEVRAELPSTTRRMLEQEVDVIFRPAGVEFEWGSEAAAPIHLTIAARPEVPVISGCSRGLHDHRLAVARLGSAAGAGRVVLWVEQVSRAASGGWDRRAPTRLPEELLARALGRALAHELGHILLGERRHHARGIMQASLSRHDLIGRRRGFSDEQLARLSVR